MPSRSHHADVPDSNAKDILHCMERFDQSDVETLLSLLAMAADPGVEKPIAWRQRDLLNGLRSFIGADAWLWFSSELRSDNEENERTSTLLYDGFRGQEPTKIFHKVSLPTVRSLFATGEEVPRNGKNRLVIPFNESCNGSSPVPNLPVVRSALTAEYCTAVRCHGDETYVGVCLYRRKRETPFTTDELRLVTVLFQSVDWLNSTQLDLAANPALSPLSPRERQVLLLLLSGKSSKEVAKEMVISTHTVADYLKQIHSKLEVSSRGELLALFIPRAR
jgi:DNA-binding CsgD family transcriptional regulator